MPCQLLAAAMTPDKDPVFDDSFSNIEDAHQYVSLLREALGEAQDTIQEHLAITRHEKGGERRVEALLLVTLKLNQLHEHFKASQTILNDLRTLRRLIFAEREDYAGVSERSAEAQRAQR
jgi:hypothetical protein